MSVGDYNLTHPPCPNGPSACDESNNAGPYRETVPPTLPANGFASYAPKSWEPGNAFIQRNRASLLRACIKLAVKALLSILVIIISGNAWGQATSHAAVPGRGFQAQQEITELEVGAQIRRQMGGGEMHLFSIRLKAGQTLRVRIEADVELRVSVLHLDGRTDTVTVGRELELKQIILSAANPETYRLAVRSLNASRRGSYKLAVEQAAVIAPLTGVDQPENHRRDEELQAQRQKKQIRTEISEIDSRIREERAKPFDGQAVQPENAPGQSLFERYRASTEKYDSIRDPAEDDAKLYVRVSGMHRTVLARVQQSLPAETTLLSYHLETNRPVAFIINSRTIIKRELNESSKDAGSHLGDFRSFANTSEMPRETLERWYSWLISPVEVYLQPGNLGIIGDGEIQYLPFAAFTRNGEEFLSDRFNLFYLPRLEMFPLVAGRRGNHTKKLLVVAPAGITGLPLLENAKKEAQSIEKLYKIKRLTGPDATKPKFVAVADKYQIIHIIAHAECNERSPKLSRILLYPDDKKDVSLWVDDVAELKLKNIELAVLSACETKVCGEYRADVINTLNDAFIVAGVPTVIASLWPVDDQAASLFMGLFYKHLKRMSKAAALAAAQNEMRATHPHPYYWAAFVLTGDPGAARANAPRRR